ncbi:neutral zinc metallopeptidase [Sphaerisporangium sp. TRM90804]|uniref:neutral zinc metallopeptidase n=1 Tax=Sphaerisporangium sp. TRM90804 TaxID=3031113 RepID=UPI002446ECDA|nr:neutral zinc metallopeptidase [Sphaerisporangium sp. TRM90804]MDH2429512.1 neutral zinc metallopeptidase [Sphaerisporangium sp. TRM90804]
MAGPPGGRPHRLPPPRGPVGPYGPRGGPGHAGWAPPRRKSSAGVVIGGLLGAVAAVFVLLVVGGALLKSARQPQPPSPVAIPTFTFPTDAPFTRAPDDTTRTGEPRATPAPSEALTRTRVFRPNTTLTRNTVYTIGALPRSACRAPATDIFDNARMKALILRTGQCMNRTWGPVLRKAGIDFAPPGYAIAARGGRGACGDFPQRGSIVPYYCPRNTTIYASTSAMAGGRGNQRGYGALSTWHGAIIGMMSHEYGHHVQHLTGLSNSWWSRTLASRSEGGRLALSRRHELQANCFGGMWMRAAAASYPIPPARRATLFNFFSNVGDWPGYPRDHGSPANSGRWFRQGYQRGTAAQCNTWLASSSSTS